MSKLNNLHRKNSPITFSQGCNYLAMPQPCHFQLSQPTIDKPRWKICAITLNKYLKRATSRMYVDVYFDDVTKADVSNPVTLSCVYSNDLDSVLFVEQSNFVYVNAIGRKPVPFAIYSISQEIRTRFCCALFCCGYVIVHNEFTWSIYPYSSGLFCWHWGNRKIATVPVK